MTSVSSYRDQKNILVIHFAGLAQTALALPAFHSLRSHFPHSRITVASDAAGSDLLKHAGFADEVLTFGRLKDLYRPATLYRSAKSIRELKNNFFDLVIEFEANTEAGIIARFVKAQSHLSRERDMRKGIGHLLQQIARAVISSQALPRHLAHEYLKILEPLGVRPIESEPRLTTDRAADERIEKILRKHNVSFGELLIGIHPGAGSVNSRWPITRFASIASRMIHNFDARVVVLAGPRERGAAKNLSSMLPAKRAIAIQSPTISELLSASARLSLLIANHSGPAHLAAAVGTPVVVASPTAGPSPQDLLGGRHEHIRASHIDLISEEQVFDAACRLLKMNRAEYLRAR